MEENKVHVTVRLGAIAVILLLIVIVSGFLRYDLGKSAFYDGFIFLSGVFFVLAILVISFFLFRLVQRSDNKEISRAGETKAMYQLLEEQRRSGSKEMVALIRLMLDSKQNQLPALPGWDDEDEETDDSSLIQSPAQTFNQSNIFGSPSAPLTEPTFHAEPNGWVGGNGYYNGNGRAYTNGNGNGRH